MAVLDRNQTMSRVDCAPPGSPIAVFHTPAKDLFESVFASTVMGRQRIGLDPRLIGVYTRREFQIAKRRLTEIGSAE